MKTFRVEIPIKGYEIYYISANNPEEALEKIKNEDYKQNECERSIDIDADYDNADIEEIEN